MRFRFLPFVVLITTCFSTFAQDIASKKTPGIGLNFFFNDFGSAAAIRANPLGSAIRDNKLSKIKDMSPGLSITFIKGVTTHLDFATTLGGSFLDYPTSTGGTLGTDGFLLEGDASLRAKMLSDEFWIVPYLSAGVGVSKYKGYFGATLPVGAGIQVNMFNNAYIILSTQYRLKITDNANYHFVHSIGFIGDLPRKK
ncbi:MAG: hypothetical protein ABI151_03250 [Chitinophagaceae bacterium]